MLRKVLARAQTQCAKYVSSAREEMVWEDFVNPFQSLPVVAEPFPHIVADDFFRKEVYQDLLAEFREVQSRGYVQDSKVANQFHAFDIDYDGYVFEPRPTLDPKRGRSFFYSLEWNIFFSRLFKQHTDFETTVAFHHHPPEDRTGFVHHDFVDKHFLRHGRLANGVIPSGTLDTVRGHGRRRIIALIFFLGNGKWQEGDGGEVGLYASDKTTLVKKVAPIDNRLLAFHISPESFHAFQQNHHDRNSIIQWFHVSSELL